MSNVFVKQAIMNGEKALNLLDVDDRKAVNLLISAKEEAAYEEGRNSNSPNRTVPVEIGCAFFFAILFSTSLFLFSRPDGWPTCELQHREPIVWSRNCQDQFGNNQYITKCSSSSRIFYSAKIGNWICEASSDDASSFSCKQSDTLPKEF